MVGRGETKIQRRCVVSIVGWSLDLAVILYQITQFQRYSVEILTQSIPQLGGEEHSSIAAAIIMY
jgi:hypothetical protein